MITRIDSIVLAAFSSVIILATLIQTAVVTSDVMPQWVQIAAMFATPLVALVGIIATVSHVGRKIEDVKDNIHHQVVEIQVTVDGMKDRLVQVTALKAEAEGALRGHAEANADAQIASDRLLMDEGLKKLGADNLLAQQATPPAEHPGG